MLEGTSGAVQQSPVGGVESFGMKVWTVVIYVELEVGDGNPLFQEHLFVEGLHFHDFGGDAGVSGAVEVGRTGQGFKTVKLYYGLRILVEEAAVGGQVDGAALFQELAVAFQKDRGGEAAVFAFGLGVGEGQPYFRDLVRSEEGRDEFDPGAEERHIGQLFFGGGLCPAPKPCALDVHADIVLVGIAAGEFEGVLPFSASELQHYRGPARSEPVPFHRVVAQTLVAVGDDLLRTWLKQAGERLVLGEFAEFTVSHCVCRLFRFRAGRRAGL